jgi:2-amino-4-hydroxy-6-hydroxymethyldihydropteridine diphosphokinase
LPGRNSAFLGLGGNIGDPAAAMAAALQALDGSADIAVRAVSSLYRTPPWGKTDQPDFLNAVAEIVTTLSPPDLLARCLEVERSLKRVRRERWGPRVIDIDILCYGDLTYSGEGLEIPHPRLAERAFVLVPLAEIAPELEIGGKPVAELLQAVDSSNIETLAGGRDWWRR